MQGEGWFDGGVEDALAAERTSQIHLGMVQPIQQQVRGGQRVTVRERERERSGFKTEPEAEAHWHQYREKKKKEPNRRRGR